MAWWVVFGHLALAAGWKVHTIGRGTLAVDVFIALSGFVIALLVAQKREAYLPYLTRRAFRIFPLYLVVLAISALLLPVAVQAWAQAPFPNSSNANRLTLAQAAQQDLPAHLIVHIPLLQGLVPVGILPGTAWTIVGQAWSISLEWQFYLLAPLMVWGLGTPHRAAATVGAMLIGAAASRWFTAAFLGSYIWHFGVGIATHALVTRPSARRFYGGLIAAFAAMVIYREGALQLIPLGIWAVVTICMTSPGWLRPLSAALGMPALVRLGGQSYSTYLAHMIPLTLAVAGLNRFALSQTAYTLLLALIVIPATYALSVFSLRWIETPGIKAGAAVSRQLAASAAGRRATRLQAS